MSNDTGNDLITRELVLSHCYKLRYDTMCIVSKMLQSTPNPTTQQVNLLMVGVQERLLEGMFFDPNLQKEVKDMLVNFHAKTHQQRIQDKRGERQRNSPFFPTAKGNPA